METAMAMNSKPSCEIIFYTLTMVLILSGIIFFYIMTYASSNVKCQLTEASLSKFNHIRHNISYEFNHTSYNASYDTLHYKLEAKITSRNPNKYIKVYYPKITAIARYKDHEFARVDLTTFDQGHKNATILDVVFEGEGRIESDEQLSEYNKDTRLGIYNNLAIDLDLLIVYKFGIYKTGRFKPPIVQCPPLNLSLISNGSNSSPHSFHNTNCRTDSFFLSR
ncbi:hypothetical protein TSUD_386590 [Trifolium subterraneum]|uniref:Late embryogenesis abundant protein LEA-2 subgroup domain-containing protein n=1 Tax=Trifolium subterraneum TaxID=3900 RepID=A0A2Z6MLR1_TRISU|nr:hypothetical protein TSUD_386590 [Trifolium subterraneum]